MATLSPPEIYQLARRHGANNGQAVIATAVALAESGGNTNAVNVVGGSGPARGSRDRGIWQINSYWHKEVSDADAFDPERAAEHTKRISSGWTNWTPWTTYTSGSYKKHLDTAVKAGGKEIPAITVSSPDVPGAVAALAAAGKAAGLEGVATDASGVVVRNAQGIYDFVQTLKSPLDVIAAVLKALVNPEFWRRFGIALLGIALVIVAIFLFSDDLGVEDLAGAATTVATKGKVSGE